MSNAEVKGVAKARAAVESKAIVEIKAIAAQTTAPPAAQMKINSEFTAVAGVETNALMNETYTELGTALMPQLPPS
jgi:hypothetical protein